MNSLGPDCNELKKKYDDCFNNWFADDFLKVSAKNSTNSRITDDSMCRPLFQVYQQCVRKAIVSQKIDLGEVDKEILGTTEEKQKPSNYIHKEENIKA